MSRKEINFAQEVSMDRLTRVFLLSFMMLFVVSRANAITSFRANLVIGNEPSPPFVTPTNSITGLPRPTPFGTATFILNDAQTALSFFATINNIDVTGTQTADLNDNLGNAHIHAGAAAAATFPVVWGFFGTPFNNNNPPDEVNTPFTGGAVGGTFSGTWDLNVGNGTTLGAQLANILAGRSYINFHTTQNSGGEIRGPILFATTEPPATMLMALGMLLMGYLFRHRLRHGQ
jgi:hypothetical protein